MPEVPSLFLYEYPSLAGPPVGIFAPEPALLEDPEARQLFAMCVGLFVTPQEDGSLDMVGSVFRYESMDVPCVLHVLAMRADGSLCLHRDEVAMQLLRDGTYFRQRYTDDPWIPFIDVLLWFQYESNVRLLMLAEALARAFLPRRDWERVFRLCQLCFSAMERNRDCEHQAARRAFAKALPQLLPGLRIAKKKPGYGWNKGQAHFCLCDQDHLCPTQFWLCPVSRPQVETLRRAIQGYKSPRGYLVAPGLDVDVVLDANMIFVPFGDLSEPGDGRPPAYTRP